MAATTPNFEGGVGMKPSEWRDIYADRPEIVVERDLIALWLEDFLRRAVADIQDEQAKAFYAKVFKDLDRPSA